MTTRRARTGLTLVELLTAIFLMAILAAIVMPAVYSRISDAQTRSKASTLSMLAQAVMTYHDHVGMWPDSLVRLNIAPTRTNKNICANAMAAKDTARWAGPYVSVSVPATGLVIGTDTIRAILTDVTSTTPNLLQIKLQYPSSDTRTNIQTILDTDTDTAAGIIRWTGTDPLMTLTYNVPITGC